MTYNRAARRGSLDKPLDFDLHVNCQGEPRVPFALHIKPKPSPQPHLTCTTFHGFSRLPAEIQGHILCFCDSATLFQLTQVSSTRREAVKIFWSYPDTWYSLDSDWLRGGGYSGEVYHDPDVLAYIKHVEVNLSHMEPEEWTDVPQHRGSDTVMNGFNNHGSVRDTPDQVLQGILESIRRFWRVLLELCPCITHVLISTSSEKQDPWDSPTAFLADFLRACPADILVSVSLLQGHGDPGDPNYNPYMERSLWQLGNNSTDLIGTAHKWEKILTDWEPKIVLLPPKIFRGPVGAFQRCHYKFERFCMQKRAAELLFIESIERHHFNSIYTPFVCFTSNCGAQFEKPGEYSLHATKTRHHEDAKLPGDMRVLFDEHRQKLDRVHREIDYEPFNFNTRDEGGIKKKSEEVLNKTWHDEDQTMVCAMEEEVQCYVECFERQPLLRKREDAANRAFLYQLEQDSLYPVSQPANKSRLYEQYLAYVEEAKQEHWELYKS